jgi:hypothetical protein
MALAKRLAAADDPWSSSLGSNAAYAAAECGWAVWQPGHAVSAVNAADDALELAADPDPQATIRATLAEAVLAAR